MKYPTKEQIITDIWVILFATDIESAPENHDILVLMCKALLQFHGLRFKEVHEIPESYIWANKDAEAHFFDTVCRGIVATEIQFAVICNLYFDFELWEIKQSMITKIAAAARSIVYNDKAAA